jgi:hypothetical protein
MRFLSLDPKFKIHGRRYFAQVALATLTLAVLLWAEDVLSGPSVARAVLVAALASSAFVLCITPHGPTASPRHTVGGHRPRCYRTWIRLGAGHLREHGHPRHGGGALGRSLAHDEPLLALIS